MSGFLIGPEHLPARRGISYLSSSLRLPIPLPFAPLLPAFPLIGPSAVRRPIHRTLFFLRTLSTENPQTYSQAYKWTVTMIVATVTLAVALASSIYSGAIRSVEEDFNPSTEVAILGVSLFVLGFAIGPLVVRISTRAELLSVFDEKSRSPFPARSGLRSRRYSAAETYSW